MEKDNIEKWDNFNCSSIRIGDYECTTAIKTNCYAVRSMVFSHFGTYFQLTNYTKQSKLSIIIWA